MAEVLRNPEDLKQAEEALHLGLESWLPTHTNDVLGVLEYNREIFPFQRIDINQYGPNEPSLEFARVGGTVLLGERFSEFVEDLQQHIPMIQERLSESKSILIATPHIPDVLDTPTVAAAVFCAAGESSFAEKTVITSGKLMSRITFFGEPAVEAISRIGEVDTSIPRSYTAQKCVGVELIDFINHSMLLNFARKARQGRLVHQAPANTRSIPTPDGYLIPRVNNETVKFITRFIGFGLPVAVRSIKDGAAGWQIGEPRQLEDNADVHTMMEDIAELSSNLFGNVRYESEQETLERLKMHQEMESI